MADSGSQHRVGKVRPPRVQITYDVEDGGSVENRELPMMVGVISDLSGDSENPTEYKERTFEEVESDGIDKLMTRISPSLQFSVSDQIAGGEDSEIGVDLKFNSIDDFSPLGVASQIPQTAKLLEARRQLADLYGKVEVNDTLEGILGEVLANEEKRDKLREQLDGLASESSDGDGEDDNNG